MDSATIGDSIVPIYRFEWSDGSVRETSDEDAFEEEPHPDAIEILAEVGRDDSDCEVTLLGFGS